MICASDDVDIIVTSIGYAVDRGAVPRKLIKQLPKLPSVDVLCVRCLNLAVLRLKEISKARGAELVQFLSELDILLCIVAFSSEGAAHYTFALPARHYGKNTAGCTSEGLLWIPCVPLSPDESLDTIIEARGGD